MKKRRLQDELGKRDEFTSKEQETLLNILRTSDEFENRLGKLFREFGLTQSQYNVLRILRGEGMPLPSLEIARRMIQVVPAITGLIDRLERQELVERQRCPEDRRKVFVALTVRARRLLKTIDEPLAELERELLGHLNRRELQDLRRLLEKARSGP